MRIYTRDPSGRFRERTISDIGLGCLVCSKCQACNPYEEYGRNGQGFAVKNPPPARCRECGEELR
jgi:ribosomal protein L40E